LEQVMNCFKAVVLLLVLIGTALSVCVLASDGSPANLSTEIKPGHWAKYVGSYPNDEYEWIQISVVNVQGSNINATMTYDIRYPHKVAQSGNYPIYERSINIDVATGSGNIFLFFVPVDLSLGDTVPVPPDYQSMNISGNAVENYAGLERAVVYAEYTEMPWLGEGTLHWDRETGILVELYVRVRDRLGQLSPSFSSLKLVETNIWSMSLLDWIATNSMFLILAPASAALQIGLLLMLIKRRECKIRVTRPRAGIVMMAVGLLLLAVGVAYLSNFEQAVFSLGFVLALVFLVVGVLVYTGFWAGNNNRINIGVVMMSLAVVLFANAFACAMYREIGALVPVTVVRAFFSARALDYMANVEVVFLRPYAWLVTPLGSIAISLFAIGLMRKFYKY
jgi:hypothetical protein